MLDTGRKVCSMQIVVAFVYVIVFMRKSRACRRGCSIVSRFLSSNLVRREKTTARTTRTTHGMLVTGLM